MVLLFEGELSLDSEKIPSCPGQMVISVAL